MKLNELRDKAFSIAVRSGWHEEDQSDEHFLCLVISELMEAVEADRKGRYASKDRFIMEFEYIVNEQNLHGHLYDAAYVSVFDKYIKDTVDDELADTCIRIFDLAGLRKTNLSDIPFPIYNSNDHKDSRKSLTFTEWVYDVTRVITGFKKNTFPIGYLLIGVLQEICCKAEMIECDILWHIEQKMKYNELRSYKHGGKKY